MSDIERYNKAYKSALYTTNYSCGVEGEKISSAIWNDPRYQKALKSNIKFFYDLIGDLENTA